MDYRQRADIDLKQIRTPLQLVVRKPAQEKIQKPLAGVRNVKRTVLIAFTISSALVSPAAMAGHDDCKVPMAQWQPREAVEQMAKARGWTVRRLKVDDGCYQIRGVDADGREIAVKVDPGSLAIVRMKHRNGRGDGDDGRHGGVPTQPFPGSPASPTNEPLEGTTPPKAEIQ